MLSLEQVDMNIMQEPKLITDTIEIGKSGLHVHRLGLGAWQWGDRFFWGYGQGYRDEDIQSAFQVSWDNGIDFFDTAEVYGTGRSEKLLGEYTRALPLTPEGRRPVIATKFMPLPWRLTRGALLRALRGSLQRLGLSQVDLYQIHVPLPPIPVETWGEALAQAVEAGLTRAVGVSNFNLQQTRRIYSSLQARQFHLASNQVEYSLLNRSIEHSGLLALCQELGITIIAYSPLAKGVLSGKYTPENPLPGPRGRIYPPDYLRRIQPLLKVMRAIGDQHDGKTPAQVALNWVIQKGALVIPGAKNVRQAQENLGALGWQLDEQDMQALDQASAEVSA
jgi:aryl-alcohol dehydrogenase-like predicted oxidoreductase